jgi:hypothetical protein
VAKTLVHYNLGGAGTPQEVKDLRQSSYDLHDELGYPVVLKHKWNAQDEKEGRARKCPFHDELYDDSPDNCPYCFGTGYVGGFADATIVYVTIQDTPTDVIRLTPQGLLRMDQHPQVTAPWLPELGDGDLLILAEFDPASWDVLDLAERYVLREVNPITVRGPGFGQQSSRTTKRFRISQESSADRLPSGHELYDVPLVFNYDAVPDDPTEPGEPDPPEYGIYTSYSIGIRVRGAEDAAFQSSTERDVKVAVYGNDISTSHNVRISGKGGGVIIDF